MDLMPLQHLDHRRNGDRHRQQLERQTLRVLHRESSRDCGKAVGTNDKLRRQAEGGYRNGHAAREIGASQELLTLVIQCVLENIEISESTARIDHARRTSP